MAVDIYQRKCRPDCGAPGLPEPEIEITEILSLEEGLEEEELEQEPEPEPLDIDALVRELDCMKRRIQQLQLKLKQLKMAECPEEQCVDFEVDLKCSENKEICALQKNQHKLQCQINELVRCSQLTRQHLEDLRQRLCEKTHQVMQLQKRVGELNCWKNTLEHEFGVCIERFEYLKHVKAEWKDVDAFLHRKSEAQRAREKAFVRLDPYLMDKVELSAELADMKEMFQKVFDLHVKRFDYLEQLVHSRGPGAMPPNSQPKRHAFPLSSSQQRGQ